MWNEVEQSGENEPGSAVRPSLTGKFDLLLDDKGRITVVAAFRKVLGSEIVLKRSYGEHSLEILPADVYDLYSQRIRKASIMDKDVDKFLTIDSARSMRAAIDKQGRLNIPAEFRRYAGIEGEVVLTGASDRLKVWSREAWEEFESQIDEEDLQARVFAKYGL